MNTWAFIQMRMNSTRLPDKPFTLIDGKTLTERVYEQVQRFQGLDGIAFLSTTHPSDDKLEEFYQSHSIQFHRGSETNIVERFLDGARKFNADRIIRVWGDCPLIHHEVAARMLERHIEDRASMTTNSQPCTFPFGLNLEIYERATLEKISVDNRTSAPHFLEFPADFIKINKTIKMLTVEHNENLSHIDLTINYQNDIKFIERIYAKLERDYPNWSLDNLIEVSMSHHARYPAR